MNLTVIQKQLETPCYRTRMQRSEFCSLNSPPSLSSPATRLCRNPRNLINVMLSKAKHLAFSRCYEVEILRLRLRMTMRHSLDAGEDEERGIERLELLERLGRKSNQDQTLRNL